MTREMTMQSDYMKYVSEVRGWIADNVDRETLAFPNDDAVWAFITETWPTMSTEYAEKLLGEAMKPIPEPSSGPTMRL